MQKVKINNFGMAMKTVPAIVLGILGVIAFSASGVLAGLLWGLAIASLMEAIRE